MKQPFTSYSFSWWQLGIFKLALLAIGALLGAYGASFVQSNVWVLIAIAAAGSAYVLYAALVQQAK